MPFILPLVPILSKNLLLPRSKACNSHLFVYLFPLLKPGWRGWIAHGAWALETGKSHPAQPVWLECLGKSHSSRGSPFPHPAVMTSFTGWLQSLIKDWEGGRKYKVLHTCKGSSSFIYFWAQWPVVGCVYDWKKNLAKNTTAILILKWLTWC